MNPMVRADVIRDGLDALPEGEAVQPVSIDGYKLLVWVCAIVTPWLAIATVAAVSVRVLS